MRCSESWTKERGERGWESARDETGKTAQLKRALRLVHSAMRVALSCGVAHVAVAASGESPRLHSESDWTDRMTTLSSGTSAKAASSSAREVTYWAGGWQAGGGGRQAGDESEVEPQALSPTERKVAPHGGKRGARG